jgi:hypothetical protein
MGTETAKRLAELPLERNRLAVIWMPSGTRGNSLSHQLMGQRLPCAEG